MKVLLFCILTISVTSAYYLKYFLNDRYPDLIRRLPESNDYAEYLHTIAAYKRRLQLVGLYPLISEAAIRHYEEKSSAQNEILFVDNVDVGDEESGNKYTEVEEISTAVEESSGNFYDNVDMEDTQNMVDTNGNIIPSYAIVDADFDSVIDLEDSNKGDLPDSDQSDRKPAVLDQMINSIVQLIVNDSRPTSNEPEVITNAQDSNKHQNDTLETIDEDFSHHKYENQPGNEDHMEISSIASKPISKQDAEPEIVNSNNNSKDSSIFDLSDNTIIDDLIENLDPKKVVEDNPSSDETITAASIGDDLSIENGVISADDLINLIDDPTGLELFDEFVTIRTETINTDQNSISIPVKFNDSDHKKMATEDELNISRGKLENKTEKNGQHNRTDLDYNIKPGFKQNEIEDRPSLVLLNWNAANMTEQLEKISNLTVEDRPIENQSSITEENDVKLANITDNETKGNINNQPDSAEQINDALKENTKLSVHNDQLPQEDLQPILKSTKNQPDVKTAEQNLAAVNISRSKFEPSLEITKPQTAISEDPFQFKAYEEIPIISNKSVKKPAAIDVPLDDQIPEIDTLEKIEAIKRKFEKSSSSFDDYEPIYDFNELSKFKVNVTENKSQKPIESKREHSLQDHIDLDTNKTKFEASSLQNNQQPQLDKDETIISNEQAKKLASLDDQVSGGEILEDGIKKTEPIFEHSSIRFDDYEPIYDFNDLSKFKVEATEKENEKLIANNENYSSVVDSDPLTGDVDAGNRLLNLNSATFETTSLIGELEPSKESDDKNESSVKASSESIIENNNEKQTLKDDDNHINKIVKNIRNPSPKLDDGIADTITDDLHNISSNEQSTVKSLNLTELNLPKDEVYNVLRIQLNNSKPIDKTDEIDIEFQTIDSNITLSNGHENFTYIEEVKDQFNDRTFEKIPKHDLLNNLSKTFTEVIEDDQNKRIETNDFYEPSQLLHDNEEAIDYNRNSFEEEIASGKIEDQRRSDILIEDNLDSYDDNDDYSITRDSEMNFEPRANQESDLLQLIPFVIEQYRRGAISKVEEDTLSKSMGDLWPIIQAEVKRKPNEEMNPVLATLLNSAQEMD